MDRNQFEDVCRRTSNSGGPNYSKCKLSYFRRDAVDEPFHGFPWGGAQYVPLISNSVYKLKKLRHVRRLRGKTNTGEVTWGKQYTTHVEVELELDLELNLELGLGLELELGYPWTSMDVRYPSHTTPTPQSHERHLVESHDDATRWKYMRRVASHSHETEPRFM